MAEAGTRRQGVGNAGDGSGRRRLPVAGLLGGLLAAYLVVPVALTLTRLGPGHWAGLGQGGVWAALGTSVAASTIALGLTTVTGVPLAWVLAQPRLPGWRRRVVAVTGAAVQVPLALPPLVSGLLLIRLVGPYTLLGRLTGGRLTESLWGIVLAQVFVAGPFLIVAARSAFAGVDPALRAVAATLGHGPWARFWRVDVGEALPGIRAGMVLTWLRAFGEFGATVLLAYHPYSLPVFTYVQFDSSGLPLTQVPVDLAIGTAVVVVALGNLRFRRRGQGSRRGAGGPLVRWGRRDAGGPLARWGRRGAGGLPTSSPVLPRPGALAPAPVDFSVATQVGGFRLDVAHRATSPRLALLGPSGAGKSLTLQLLAGVRRSAGGWVRLGGEDVGSCPPERRGLGYVPQGGGLMPRLDVWEQVTFGAFSVPLQAEWWLDRLGLTHLQHRLPHQLSGGQAQRVALARALAGPARLLLLDEPLSALDTPQRRALRAELRDLQMTTGMATVVVTHDPEEAAVLADELVVVAAGQVLQAGPRRLLFRRPASLEVAALLGLENVGQGSLTGTGEVAAGGLLLPAVVDTPVDDHVRPVVAGGEPVLWSVDPHQVVASVSGRWPAEVLDVVDAGRRVDALLRLGSGLLLTSHHPSAERLDPGSPVRVDLPPVDAWPVGGRVPAVVAAGQPA